MKLGIVSDIHEHVEPLRRAVDRFERVGIDEIIVLGDICDDGERLEETCDLLIEAGAIGVWGNHDFGLIGESGEGARRAYRPSVSEFMLQLKPTLQLDGCHFSHIEPWLDPYSVADLWHFDGVPMTQEQRDRIFGAVSERVIFVGHYHQWLLASPDAVLNWKGEAPLQLSRHHRSFIVIGAVADGASALFDTEDLELTPFSDAAPESLRTRTTGHLHEDDRALVVRVRGQLLGWFVMAWLLTALLMLGPTSPAAVTATIFVSRVPFAWTVFRLSRILGLPRLMMTGSVVLALGALTDIIALLYLSNAATEALDRD